MDVGVRVPPLGTHLLPIEKRLNIGLPTFSTPGYLTLKQLQRFANINTQSRIRKRIGGYLHIQTLVNREGGGGVCSAASS